VAADPSKSNLPVQLYGKLLIADPSLRDGTFKRSVILLTDYSPVHGSSGLILNHPTGRLVGDYLKRKEFTSLRHIPVHLGGPVLHEQLTFASFWWSKKLGLRWALRISAKQAALHSHRPGRVVRAFLGYAGWTSGQLENELLHHSWIPVAPQPELLGHEHDLSLWPTLLRPISPLHRVLAEAPSDPFLN
jgi:putative transcriptional regulator